jgi:hypothetical protein
MLFVEVGDVNEVFNYLVVGVNFVIQLGNLNSIVGGECQCISGDAKHYEFELTFCSGHSSVFWKHVKKVIELIDLVS